MFFLTPPMVAEQTLFRMVRQCAIAIYHGAGFQHVYLRSDRQADDDY